MTWLYNNLSTIIVSLIVLTVVILVVRKLIRDKKQGKSSCGCGCDSCAMSGQCHKR